MLYIHIQRDSIKPVAQIARNLDRNYETVVNSVHEVQGTSGALKNRIIGGV